MAPKPLVSPEMVPDSIFFNHEIYLDLMCTETGPDPPILHNGDRGTYFSAVQVLIGESAEEVWNAFITC